MTLARIVGGIGRTLIGLGTLILLFVAYQLWGTGLQEARAQRELVSQFETALEEQAALVPDRPAPARPARDPGPTSTTVDVAPPPPPEGEAVAIIKLPTIGVEKAVVEGVTVSALKRGPGRYPDTPMPGQPGNAAIAGHRTTYGAPFHDLDQLEEGDPIFVTTRQGQFEYRVRETKIVTPDRVDVLDPTEDNRLTLTTCHPRFSAAQRLIVIADLIGEAAPAPPVAEPVDQPADRPEPGGTPAELPDEELGEELDGELDDAVPAVAFDADLSGEAASNGPAIAWGTLCALLLLGVWALGKVWRRWPAYLLGAPVFLVVLFIFFESFARLLPANI